MVSRAYGKGRRGLKKPCAWCFTKPLLPAHRRLLFSHTFCLLICRINANTTELICMKSSRNMIVNGPKRNNYRFWWESRLSSASRNQVTTFCFRPLSMFNILFHDSPLYPTQLSLFCLLWLISASADHIGYITSFCSMIKQLHELKNSSCYHRSIHAFW